MIVEGWLEVLEISHARRAVGVPTRHEVAAVHRMEDLRRVTVDGGAETSLEAYRNMMMGRRDG